VVEHIGFDQQQLLVSNAIRVLKPGGLLIMETPNPENIMVGTARFYLDPTHLRPIPPSSLSFLAKFHKFHRVKTLRLQESQNLRERDVVGLLDVLEGVSPDYAIVAQKQGETEIMTALDAAFDRDYGLSLESLTSRYDMRINAHITQAESRAQQAESRAQQAENRPQQAENRAQQAENRAQQAEIQVRQASHEASAYRQQAESAQARVEALYSSTSWRITRPLRGIKRALCGDIRPVHEFFAKTTLKIKTIVRPLVARAIRFVFGHPALRAPLSRAIKKWPWLHRRLRRVAANTGAVPEFAFCRVPVPGHIANDAGSETLSPHARRIFMKLKKAVAQRQRGAN
jgi:O-antigen chain-terminating methyltransferase